MNKNDNVGPKRQTGLWLSLGHKPVGLVVQEGTVANRGEVEEGQEVQLRPVASAKTFVQTQKLTTSTPTLTPNCNCNCKLNGIEQRCDAAFKCGFNASSCGRFSDFPSTVILRFSLFFLSLLFATFVCHWAAHIAVAVVINGPTKAEDVS